MNERIRNFMVSLQAPAEFQTDEAVRNVLLMLYPTYALRQLGPKLGLTGTMG